MTVSQFRHATHVETVLRKIEDKTTIVFLTSHLENALEEVAESCISREIL